ncbi:hypothetical protein BJ322DRAFT_1220106 [Thelephora terrestris]|uniref:Uncharacterized protein n=1 Tax=Thelephora terrestris TaxID=56493 RepID=A0A9P6HBT6_9AGAM|nr:hypothetical protein BJ322DRAFT_1220106 [Thelephora terrestris]
MYIQPGSAPILLVNTWVVVAVVVADDDWKGGRTFENSSTIFKDDGEPRVRTIEVNVLAKMCWLAGPRENRAHFGSDLLWRYDKPNVPDRPPSRSAEGPPNALGYVVVHGNPERWVGEAVAMVEMKPWICLGRGSCGQLMVDFIAFVEGSREGAVGRTRNRLAKRTYCGRKNPVHRPLLTLGDTYRGNSSIPLSLPSRRNLSIRKLAKAPVAGGGD